MLRLIPPFPGSFSEAVVYYHYSKLLHNIIALFFPRKHPTPDFSKSRSKPIQRGLGTTFAVYYTVVRHRCSYLVSFSFSFEHGRGGRGYGIPSSLYGIIFQGWCYGRVDGYCGVMDYHSFRRDIRPEARSRYAGGGWCWVNWLVSREFLVMEYRK